MTFLFILFVIFLISLLILVHEWGHFFSARVLGVKVEEFGFGFPPRLFSKMKNAIFRNDDSSKRISIDHITGD